MELYGSWLGHYACSLDSGESESFGYQNTLRRESEDTSLLTLYFIFQMLLRKQKQPLSYFLFQSNCLKELSTFPGKCFSHFPSIFFRDRQKGTLDNGDNIQVHFDLGGVLFVSWFACLFLGRQEYIWSKMKNQGSMSALEGDFQW